MILAKHHLLNFTKITAGFLLIAFSFSGCLNSKNDPFDAVAQFEKEVTAIDAYLDDQGVTYTKDGSGIRMVVTKIGYGLPALANDVVEVQYKGMLFSTGETFEESTATGSVVSFIRGWQFALETLPVGSEATIYIPSFHGYGNYKTNSIPANSTLVFDIKFKKVTHTQLFLDQFKNDTTAIRNYLEGKQVANVVADTTGIKYVITEPGNTTKPTWYSAVTLKYYFRLLSNDSNIVATFERQPTSTFSSRVVDYIQGMQVVLQHLGEGGKARVYIPSGLGFGINPAVDSSGNVVVPYNSNLIVDIELTDVN